MSLAARGQLFFFFVERSEELARGINSCRVGQGQHCQIIWRPGGGVEPSCFLRKSALLLRQRERVAPVTVGVAGNVDESLQPLNERRGVSRRA